MSNSYFSFKQFTVNQDKCAMKVCTDSCLFGASAASMLSADVKSILDIGAGTGLLSLMLAQQSMAYIEAVEIDEEAARQAAENFLASPWQQLLKIIKGNILEYSPPRQYDFIISNPPFFEGDLRAEKESANRARHDTGLTLTGLLNSVNRLLDKEMGTAALLLPANRSEECLRKASAEGLFAYAMIDVRQTPEHRPFRSMIWFKRTVMKEPLIKEICIQDETGEYSQEFRDLLKDYYLNL